MIDFLKILILNKQLINELFNNHLLKNHFYYKSFKNNLNKEAEEIKQAKVVKEYRELLFCFYIKNGMLTKLEILFKPHYYFNNNLHNANDFTVLDCIMVLKEIRNTFNLPVKELLILNLEFGVNALSPIDCKKLISYTIYHERNEFINTNDSLKYSKISFKHDRKGRANNYKIIKFYAKGLQFSEYIDSNTFRLEVKSKRRKFIQKFKIYTYADLLKPKTYHKFAKIIKQEWSKVLILDIDNNKQNLNSNEIIKLKKHLNSFEWIKAIESSKNTFNNHKIKYFKLLNKTGSNIHTVLLQIIDKKLNDLLKNCAVLIPQKGIDFCAVLNSNIIGNGTNKMCLVTGLDISMQNENSFLLSHTGLKYYYRNDRDIFEEIKRYYLTRKWIYYDLQTQIREIAHIIRDKWRRKKVKYGIINQLTICKIDEIRCNPKFNYFNNYNINLK